MLKLTAPLRGLAIFGLCLLPLTLTGCGGNPAEYNYPSRKRGESAPVYGERKHESIFGEGGLTLFGGGKKKAEEGGAGIGVNSFLWRASLDTVAFMPLASADPFGGVIITDWYAPSETPGERFKVTVFIMDRALRADGVKVSVFRQARAADGGWIDQPVDARTATDMENAILTRARQLRIAAKAKDD